MSDLLSQPSRAAFKAYDIRGRVPDDINENFAYRIGKSFAALFHAKKVAVGRDVRLSSESLCAALTQGLTDAGCNVIDIGRCGTEMVYFSTFHLKLDGGIMVTASHNPSDYNGMKLVRSGARPVSGDSGLRELEDMAVRGTFKKTASGIKGAVTYMDVVPDYITHLLSYIDRTALRRLKVVVNAGNGCAGPVLDALSKHLPFKFVRVNFEPDGSFPNGVPNPLLEENRAPTKNAILDSGADFGVAWDGDYDRCFLFDEKGCFIEGYYIVGFLAQAILKRHPGAKIIHDPRLTWNTIEQVRDGGGIPIQSKTGHAFIKERMRAEDAVYGGELSAHHYFKEFSYCDSGMIPWLLIAEIVCREGKALSDLIGGRMRRFPVSGEINRTVPDPQGVIDAVEEKYAAALPEIDRTDGLSMEFDNWRFNLRSSNTEPVLRLNVETKGGKALLRLKTNEILTFIDQY